MKKIGFAGIIGSGKTTFAIKMFGELVIAESLQNSKFLKLFYGNQKSNAFALELFSVLSRANDSRDSGVYDRTEYEDMIFINLLHKSGDLTDDEYMIIKQVYETMIKKYVSKYDIIYYMRVTPKTALSRIKTRGRTIESKIPIEYLTSLAEEYDKTFKSLIPEETKVIEIDNNIDL